MRFFTAHAGRAEELRIRSDTLGGAQHRVIAGHLVEGQSSAPSQKRGLAPPIRAATALRSAQPVLTAVSHRENQRRNGVLPVPDLQR